MIERQIDVYNYHALGGRIASLYGKSILGLSKRIEDCLPIDDGSVLGIFQDREIPLSKSDNRILTSFSSAVRDCDDELLEKRLDDYCHIVISVLVPNGYITYNGKLALTLKILRESEDISSLYKSLYDYIVIDEAQDTNILSYKLLKELISDSTRIYMFGDPLQKIYGFIGAIPEFDKIVINEFGLHLMRLDVNHRFAVGSPMQLLDKNIRANIINPFDPKIEQAASVPMFFLGSANGEADRVCAAIKHITLMQPCARIAVLMHSRGFVSSILPEKMESSGIEYFNALFDDDDEDYIKFNGECMTVIDHVTEGSGSLSLSLLRKAAEQIDDVVEAQDYKFGTSYKSLFAGLCSQVESELRSVDSRAKYEFVMNVLHNRSLKHALDYIPSQVSLSTIHSAKGLEWDYVIIPEMMQWVTPSYMTCEDCAINKKLNFKNHRKCQFIGKELPASYIDELCVFYVAVTRAKKGVVFLATTERVNSKGKRNNGDISCMLLMKGIEIFKPNSLNDIVILS